MPHYEILANRIRPQDVDALLHGFDPAKALGDNIEEVPDRVKYGMVKKALDNVRGIDLLGEGSSRVAFDLYGSPYVLKLAKNEAGIEQSLEEVDVSEEYGTIFSQVMAYDVFLSHDGPMWVIVEKAHTLISTDDLSNLDEEEQAQKADKVLKKFFGQGVTSQNLFILLSTVVTPTMVKVLKDQDRYSLYREMMEEGNERFQEYHKGLKRPLPLIDRSEAEPLAGVISLPPKTRRSDYMYDVMREQVYRDQKVNPYYGLEADAVNRAESGDESTRQVIKEAVEVFARSFFKKSFDPIKKELVKAIYSRKEFDPSDLLRLDHWGIVMRKGKPCLVVIDYGFTEKMAAERYRMFGSRNLGTF